MDLRKSTYVKNSNDLHLHCPVCGYEYTHLVKIDTVKDNEERLHATLHFTCENGCKFTHEVENRKGYTLIK